MFIVLSTVLCAFAVNYYREYGIEALKSYVSGMGSAGILIMFMLQICQVVMAVIPGEPMELIAGALYGTWGGLLLCLAGCAVGTALIFLLVRWFGKGFTDSFMDTEKFTKLKFLKDPKKRDVLVFILMFIPGTPKDLLTYFAPFSGMSIVKFLIISTLARIPSVLTSTYVGATFADGSYLKSAVAFAVVGIISIAGILLYNKIIEKKNRTEKIDGNEKQN